VKEEDEKSGYSSKSIKGRCPVESSRLVVVAIASTKITWNKGNESSSRKFQGVF
jgi:hypothetical protein